ncbi:sensor domain-containing diguanylate cyclase [Pandoraea captiosa]|uniref:Sensor domain-containing diguanylate cyclase n=1 Tax=Pandoraea captiosa TaxID=2508302 RepID=A0A5E4ZMY7_9BURK|nr:sensor domain-containing diguanylate cyclase [Pandoraea captiosa]VVE61735.1 sensor domain-containing diguanylate cyclase [Pandoraea captiosa]
MEFVTKEVLASCMELLLDAVFLVNRAGTLVYVSPACEAILGYSSQELMGRSMIDFVAKEDRERTIEESKLVMAGRARIGFENRYIHKDGHYVHIMWSARWSEEHGLRIGVARDVSARKRAEALQRATYSISEAAHDAADIRSLCKAVHDTLGSLFPIDAIVVTTCDAQAMAWDKAYQYRESAEVPWVDWAQAEQLSTQATDAQAPLWRLIEVEPGDTAANAPVGVRAVPLSLDGNVEAARHALAVLPMHTARRAVGTLMIYGPVRALQAEAAQRLLAFVCDQTALAIERKQLIDDLYNAARFDELTGLPNRRTFGEYAGDAVRRAQRTNGRLALLFADVDGFKDVNDSLGHAVGDIVLREIGRRMQVGVTDCGFAARYSGDEFVALVHDAEIVDRIDFALTRLRAEIEQVIAVDNAQVAVRVSFGVAVFPDDGESMNELIRVADQRMYANKAARKSGGASFLERLL